MPDRNESHRGNQQSTSGERHERNQGELDTRTAGDRTETSRREAPGGSEHGRETSRGTEKR